MEYIRIGEEKIFKIRRISEVSLADKEEVISYGHVEIVVSSSHP